LYPLSRGHLAALPGPAPDPAGPVALLVGPALIPVGPTGSRRVVVAVAS